MELKLVMSLLRICEDEFSETSLVMADLQHGRGRRHHRLCRIYNLAERNTIGLCRFHITAKILAIGLCRIYITTEGDTIGLC